MRKTINITIAIVLILLLILSYSKHFNHLLLTDASIPKEKIILQTRNNGFKTDSLPNFSYFLQDDTNPSKIVAVKSKASGIVFKNYTITKNKDTVLNMDSEWYKNSKINKYYYWKSDDFGANWALTDSSIFSKWNIRDSIVHEFSYNVGIYDIDSSQYFGIQRIKDSEESFYKTQWLNDTIIVNNTHCILNYKNNRYYINNNPITTGNDYQLKNFDNWAWVDKQKYFAVNTDGILIGKRNTNCEPVEQMFWKWSFHKQHDPCYKICSPKNHITIFVENYTDELKGRTLIEQKSLRKGYISKSLLHRKIVIRKQADTLEFILPSYDNSGLWFGKVPLNKTYNFRLILFYFIKYHIIIYLLLLYLGYILYQKIVLTSDSN